MADERATAITARDDALEAFEEAGAQEDPIEKASGEQRAADDFLTILADCIVDGLSVAQARQHCDVVADSADHYNKTTLTELLEEKIEEKKEAECDRPPFDEVIQEELKEVLIIRTTDAKQSAHYRWHFRAGTVETTSNAEGRAHFSWARFRDEYYDGTGEDPSKPTKERRGGEEWREFIVGVVEERGREVTTRGPRSTAVDALKNFIRRTDAYNDLDHVAERDGIYLDADPAEEEPKELWVPNHHIKRIVNDAELNSTVALQTELDSRGLAVPDRNGVSYSTFVGNNKMTFWVLDPDIATPASFTADPTDPAEQVRLEQEEEDDDDDDEPGALGSVGGDSDE